MLRLALIGNPNSGKTTLFNLLIGLNGYTISSGVISKALNISSALKLT